MTDLSFHNADNFIRNAVTIALPGGASAAESVHLRRVTWSETLPVSLEAVALDLRLDAPDDEQGTLEAMVRGAAAFLERRTGYVIQQGTYELLAPSFWSGALEIRRTPLRSIEALEYQGSRDNWSAVDPEHYWTSPRERSFLVRMISGFTFPTLWQNEDCVRLRFTAGFDAEDESGSDQMDPACRTCLMMLVAHYYQNRELFLAGKLEQVEMGAGNLLGALRTFW